MITRQRRSAVKRLPSTNSASCRFSCPTGGRICLASRMSLRAHPDVERRGESPGLSADTPDFAVTHDTADTPDTRDSPDILATNARRRAEPTASDDTRDIANTPDTPSTNTRLGPPIRLRPATRATPPTQATFPTRHPQNRVTLSSCPKRRLNFFALACRCRSRVFVCSPLAAARSRARPLLKSAVALYATPHRASLDRSGASVRDSRWGFPP